MKNRDTTNHLKEFKMENTEVKSLGWAAGGLGWLLLVITSLVLLSMCGCPQYEVYR